MDICMYKFLSLYNTQLDHYIHTHTYIHHIRTYPKCEIYLEKCRRHKMTVISHCVIYNGRYTVNHPPNAILFFRDIYFRDTSGVSCVYGGHLTEYVESDVRDVDKTR